MHPIFLEIGSFQIRTYGVMAAIGFLCGCFTVNYLRKYAKMSADQASGTMFVALIAGIIGARLFYVVQYFQQYRNHLWNIVRIDQGGLVFYGGFILAILSLIVYCRRQKLDMIRVLDVFAPAIAIAHCCGRIGCFFNGCCYGTPTGGDWGVVVPGSGTSARLHPVQLYEAGEMFVLFWIFLYLVKHTRRGVALSAYLLIYGILRFVNEQFRGDNPRAFDLFTPAQLIGLAIIPVSLGMLIWFLKNAKPNA